MRRVLIVTPSAIASNPRVVKEANALCAAGFDVHVCSMRMLDAVDRLEDAIIAGAGWTATRIDFRSSRARLEARVKQIAARKMWKFSHWHVLSSIAHSSIAVALQGFVLRYPADLYVAHYPAALEAVARAAKKFGGKYAYDAEDFHLGDWPDEPSYEIERELVREIEVRYLLGCKFVTAASPLIAEGLVQAYGIEPPRVVLNAFPRSQAPPTPTARGTASPGPSLYWFSQTIGPNRGLECAIRAIGLSSHRPNLYLRGTPAVGYLEELQKLACEAGAEGRLHFLPPASPERMEALAAEYDLGLASEVPINRNREVCLTNKLFSFILAGIPPLMSATAAQQRFAIEAGLADLVYPIGDAPALANLIDHILAEPAQLASLREKIWRLGRERYNWETEAAVLTKLYSNS